VKSRAGTIYQISYYRAGERIRKTFADLNEAKREWLMPSLCFVWIIGWKPMPRGIGILPMF